MAARSEAQKYRLVSMVSAAMLVIVFLLAAGIWSAGEGLG